MPPRAFVFLLVVACGLVIGAAGVGAATPVGTHQTIEIDLHTDGDARWHVTTRHDLGPDDGTTFETVAERYEAGDVESETLGAVDTAVSNADAATEREMGIADIERSADRQDGVAEYTLSFTWENFARVEEDTLTIGDTFRTDDRWLTRLGPNQTLIVDPPAGYGPTDWQWGIEDGQSRIEGPHEFEPGALSGTFVGGVGQSNEPWLPVVGALVVVVAIVGLGGWLYTRRPAESTADATGPSNTPDPTDPELLSDEERVEALLEQNGGRMKQAAIVEATGWSNAKVSQLLSEMAENDRIDKLRIGRENLISFPDEEIED